ncbi:hypothetical protein AAZV13_11G179700 [Glycine max]
MWFVVLHVIGSPGFTKDQFHRHLFLEAEQRELRPIIENKSRIILVHTSSGYNYLHFRKEAFRAEMLKVIGDSTNPCILANYNGPYTYSTGS